MIAISKNLANYDINKAFMIEKRESKPINKLASRKSSLLTRSNSMRTIKRLALRRAVKLSTPRKSLFNN